MEAMMRAGVIDWGLATRTAPSAHVSGDAHVIHEWAGGMLMGVMDGLGHGPEAAVASRTCASLLVEHAGLPLDQIVAMCHEGLRETRGVALTICSLDENTAAWSWIGVGNVAGVLLREGAGLRREREFLHQRNGVVGSHLPHLKVSAVSAAPGDVMILATDGVRASFADELDPIGDPQRIAERILAMHANGRDDALALVARYAGVRP